MMCDLPAQNNGKRSALQQNVNFSRTHVLSVHEYCEGVVEILSLPLTIPNYLHLGPVSTKAFVFE